MDEPTKDEAIAILTRLAKGEITGVEAAQWAEQIDYPENEVIAN